MGKDITTIAHPKDLELAVPPIGPGGSGMTLRQVAKGFSEWVTPKWARACNVEYRSGPSGPPVSLIVEGRKVWSRGDLRWPVFMCFKDRAEIAGTTDYDRVMQARFAFSAGPWLVRGGAVSYTDLETARLGQNGYSGLTATSQRERAAIGIRQDGMVVHYATMAATLVQLAEKMKALGCVDAINVDGGGSVGVLDGGSLFGYSVRHVCCALMFKEILNEKPAAPGLPTVNLDLDFSRKLTQNFRLSEFACKHCGAVSISPGFAELVARLQVLRDKAGKPVNVTSGYRCATHDARVGTSASPGRGPHTTGTAADIYISGMTVDKLAQLANESGFTGIGRYHGQGFVHVDLRQPPSYFVG